MTWKSRKKLQWIVFFMGLLVMAFGAAMMITAELGSAPWDVLHIGLYVQLGLSIGTWSILVGFIIIAATAWMERKPPLLGAFLNMLFVGIFIDACLSLPFMRTPDSLLFKTLMLAIGILILGFGIGLYISSDRGAGPRDHFMLAMTERTGLKVSRIRLYMELAVLFLGWLMGGPVSYGTVIFCLSIGSIVGITLPYCQNKVNGLLDWSEHGENINKRQIRVNHHDSVSEEIR
ncbi:YitT family protein [Fictibacillus iocasae]|uniref:YitT family protein n=1 Tax=Fictibacillus iocasae TaxID=2715437 RepID=A0ABW2NU38_9BACL